MASIIYKPTTPEDVRVVTVGEVQYTFFPGQARDVPKEHLAAVTTALQTTGVVTNGPAEL